jgi:hypothetical protein
VCVRACVCVCVRARACVRAWVEQGREVATLLLLGFEDSVQKPKP